MKRILCGVGVLSVLLLALGCSSGKKVALLEKQVAQEQSEKEALKAEVNFLRQNLAETRSANDSLQLLLQHGEAALAEAEQRLQQAQKPVAPPMPVPSPPEDLPVVKPGADFQKGYDRALELFHKSQYAPAAESFSALLESNRNHRLTSNCQYWLGECLYAQKQYENALAEFQKVLAYPYTTKADAAQFKIGMCCLQMGKNAEAREEFNRLIAAYPDSKYVSRARAHLDKLP